MDISKYIDEHLDELIDNPDAFLNTQIESIDILKNHIESETESEIKKETNSINSDDLEYLKDLEYLEYDLDESDNLDKTTNTEINKKNNEINEDDYQDDIESELFEKKFEKKLLNLQNLNNNNIFNKKNNIIKEEIILENEKNKEDEEEEDDDEDKEEQEALYYIELINIFLKYYNEKYDKTDNFFTGIKNNQTDTSNPMELFFEAIFEFEQFKKIIINEIPTNIDINNKQIVNNFVMKFIFTQDNPDKITTLFEIWENQMYCLIYKGKKYISPSLLICLNFIHESDIIYDEWNIFNLRDN